MVAYRRRKIIFLPLSQERNAKAKAGCGFTSISQNRCRITWRKIFEERILQLGKSNGISRQCLSRDENRHVTMRGGGGKGERLRWMRKKHARRAPFAELASVFSNLGDVLKFLIPSSNSQTKYPEEGRGFCLARWLKKMRGEIIHIEFDEMMFLEGEKFETCCFI